MEFNIQCKSIILCWTLSMFLESVKIFLCINKTTNLTTYRGGFYWAEETLLAWCCRFSPAIFFFLFSCLPPRLPLILHFPSGALCLSIRVEKRMIIVRHGAHCSGVRRFIKHVNLQKHLFHWWPSCCCHRVDGEQLKNHHHHDTAPFCSPLSIAPLKVISSCWVFFSSPSTKIILLWLPSTGQAKVKMLWAWVDGKFFLLIQFLTQPKMFISFDVAREEFSCTTCIYSPRCNRFAIKRKKYFDSALCFIGKIVMYTESETR